MKESRSNGVGSLWLTQRPAGVAAAWTGSQLYHADSAAGVPGGAPPDWCLLQWLPACQKQPSRWLAGLPGAALRCPDSNQRVVTRQMTKGARTLGMTVLLLLICHRVPRPNRKIIDKGTYQHPQVFVCFFLNQCNVLTIMYKRERKERRFTIMCIFN